MIKAITTTRTVLHVPVQVCFGAIHSDTFVLVLLFLTQNSYQKGGNAPISNGTTAELLYIIDSILCTCKACITIIL